MMKKIYFLLLVLFGLNVNAQIVNIPNANFKAILLSASPSNQIASIETPMYNPATETWSVSSYQTIDVNNNGEIEVSEAQQIKYLSLSNLIISNLTGIEAFINLQYLNCNYNQLTSLDVSGLINLEYFDCSQNQLSSIDVSGLTNLKNLICFGNQLTNLDVSGLINLQFLNFHNNQLTNINVSGLTNLKQLYCIFNQLSNLDVSGLTNLQSLSCYGNHLNNLDISGLTNLNWLDCQNNQLTTLDLSQCMNLQNLRCNNNQLTYLILKCGNLNWSNLDFSNNSNLQYICSDVEDVFLVQQKINMYGYTNCNVNSYCSFIPGGVFYEIIGNAKFDSNANGCDNLDFNYSNLKFNQTVSNNLVGVYIANPSGNYNIPVQAGSHTITPNLENQTYFNISPTNITVDFPTQSSPFVQDFCVTANGVHHDVEVVVLPTVPARPGFDAKYKIIYRNKGNQIENGAVTFTYNDAVLDYIAANPVYDSQATDSFIWNYSNLLPFETREIEVVFNVNSPMETPAVNIGDQLNFLAQITPTINDEVLYDNTSAIKQIVVGSYDPNDKTCLEGETVGPDMIGEYVHYLIRFENTGTYPAENVVVKDMIDLAKFDIATLIPLKGSHDFYTRIKDNKVEFIFENINLDFNDATNDGYVSFKIKTKSNLVVGNTFSNDANIYFDYNFPITTNTYTTTIQTLSIQDFDFGSQFTLYPNPVKDVLHFNSNDNLEIQSVEIYNMLGQIVVSVPNATTSIDVSSLTKGNYFVKVNTEKGSANTKFVKE